MLLVVAGCSSSNDQPGNEGFTGFNGAWVDCSFDGVKDRRDVFVIGGGTSSLQSFTYDTVDGSCGGARTTDGPTALSLTVGAEVPATLGTGTVTAREVDLVQTSAPYEALYTILWRDTSELPNVLYMGDNTATMGLDGSAPGQRPTVLEDWRRRYLQTTPHDADLFGTWVTECMNDGVSDLWQEITISTISSQTALSFAYKRYTSTDGTCSSGTWTAVTYSSPMTIGGPVYATLGPRTVTALDMNTENSYSILWVDTSVTPNVLYMGDGTATAGYDGTSAATRPTVLDDGKPYTKQ